MGGAEDFRSIIEDLIDTTTERDVKIRFARVRKVDLKEAKVDIQMYPIGKEVKGVDIAGIGLAEDQGVYVVPRVGDYVVVLEYKGKWYILNYLFDVFSGNGKPINALKEGEIHIRAKGGGKIKLDSDGNIKVFNNGNYGIEITADGTVNIYGRRVNFYKRRGRF